MKDLSFLPRFKAILPTRIWLKNEERMVDEALNGEEVVWKIKTKPGARMRVSYRPDFPLAFRNEKEYQIDFHSGVGGLCDTRCLDED